MPTYQYACTACGHQLEAVQSFTDEPLTECPECAGRLRKQFSAVGVVFKGSGFYRTDSRSSSTSKPASSTSTSEKASEKSSEKSSSDTTSTTTKESKPAATSSAGSSSSSASAA
ncbi:FmdB family transcriptional regulator [Dactylosporangium roseum]|uniref:FmdB family transcriptional regulator n=1 Tax=Dactylosporangium roseum TaxID=47989 RepID=A0ABY5Z9J4_9ACTN|nr:FmdB family zinc ribbon protein [Dactylosporangium roseum]UWZ37383.1 FmdB family transcriptional regulator [Dactylosporangium roseum]